MYFIKNIFIFTFLLTVFILIPTTIIKAQTAPTNGLVGHWTFDDGAGAVAKDSSGNGNDGTLVNGPTWTAGKVGGALQFDGNNKTRVIANVANNMPEFTACVWVNPDSLTNIDGDPIIYLLNKGFMLTVDNSGILSFKILTSSSYSSVSGSVNISTGVWQNICGVYRGVGIISDIS